MKYSAIYQRRSRAIKDELLDKLLEGYEKPEDLLGEGGIFQELKKALLEKALGAELTHHLGYEKGEKPDRKVGNSRNGHDKKKVKGQNGEMDIAVPATARVPSSLS